jgi:intein-encoded DNA endonuclease-like protein
MNCKTNPEMNTDICNLYRTGIGSNTISKIYELHPSTILNIIRKNNIDIKKYTYYRKYSFNYNFFDEIDSEFKAYFLGFIIADGSISGNTLSISIIEDDVDVLFKFKENIEFNGFFRDVEYSNSNHKNQKSIILTSKYFINSLSKYGIVNAKSHKTFLPKMSDKFIRHFIRGVFDGDGCIHISKSGDININLVGNIDLMTEIQNILVSKCGLNYTKFGRSKSENIVYIKYGGNIQTIKILSYLYDNSNVYMDRKFMKFKKCLNMLLNNKPLAKTFKPKKVYKYLDGVLISKYNSLTDAGVDNLVSRKTISRYIDGINNTDYFWSYELL